MLVAKTLIKVGKAEYVKKGEEWKSKDAKLTKHLMETGGLEEKKAAKKEKK